MVARRPVDPALRDIAGAPLRTAASLLAIQAIGLLLVAGMDLASLHRSRLAMGIASAVFFVILAGVLGFCAVALSRVRPGARGPAVLAQLLFLGFAWNVRSTYTWLAIVVAISAVVVIVGIVHPDSMARLERARDAR